MERFFIHLGGSRIQNWVFSNMHKTFSDEGNDISRPRTGETALRMKRRSILVLLANQRTTPKYMHKPERGQRPSCWSWIQRPIDDIGSWTYQMKNKAH
jgi:hypothetical protein